MRAEHLIAIAASAGGLSALRLVLAGLPAPLPASLVIVQHLAPNWPSHLVEILRWNTHLLVEEARPMQPLRMGTAYVAPPDVHVTVGIDHRLVTSHLPPVNFCRPSADRLFASIGPSFGAQAIAVVLTGMGSDGARGAQEVRRHGGTVIVQDAAAAYPGMPLAAVRAGRVDQVLPLEKIAGALRDLVGTGEAA